MRIKNLFVDNFKSLVDFELPLTKFNCIVGLNGSGKSTVLQFFDFMSRQVKGDLSGWLRKRQWEAHDINSKLTPRNNIKFEVVLVAGDNVEIKWHAGFNRRTLNCTSELIEWNNCPILKVEDGHYAIWDLNERDRGNGAKLSGAIAFDYQGSLLSQIKRSQLTRELLKLKCYFEEVHALDLLAPELLRLRSKESNNGLGLGGEHLSSFLHEIGETGRNAVIQKISSKYRNIKKIDVTAMRSGWKKLTVHEKHADALLKTEARHVSDGFLRMLAVFAQLSKEQSCLLLDEIENGINPEMIELLIDGLVEAAPQVLVTTHSPMVLNYLDDDVAAEGVVYLYKDRNGATRAVRFFDIPSMREKLTVMGPGEAYEDTVLPQLVEEIELLKSRKH